MVAKKTGKVHADASASGEAKKRQAELKWGTASMEAGYTIVPNVLITRHLQVGLDAVDLALVLLLASHWWTADTKPFPSKKRLAKAIGRDATVVRKRLQALERDRLIKRIFRKRDHGGNNTNLYDLSPLAKEINRLSRQDIAERDNDRLSRVGKRAPKVSKVSVKAAA
jgi:predicted transcriptional regulator